MCFPERKTTYVLVKRKPTSTASGTQSELSTVVLQAQRIKQVNMLSECNNFLFALVKDLFVFQVNEILKNN